MELPPYRKPLVKNVLTKSWIRMRKFVYIAIPLLALGGIAYGIPNKTGFTALVVKPLSPTATWLALPVETVIR